MLKLKLFILFYSYFAINFAFGQMNDKVNKPKYVRISETYGYLLGQDYSLNRIKEMHPILGTKIFKAQMEFKTTFTKSPAAIKNYMINYLGDNKFIEFEKMLIEKLDAIWSNQILSKDESIIYISDIESRANGNIPITILATLLSFEFADKPHNEFLYGFISKFNTSGHTKSNNTNWQLSVPISWKSVEADRPSIIKKFISDYGDGNQSIMLAINDLPINNENKTTQFEVNNLFNEKEMKASIPESAKFISFKEVTLDNHKGGVIEFEQIITRLDFKIKIRMVQFMFVNNNKMHIVQGIITASKLDEDLSIEIKKFMPLFNLVANSIVVND